MEPPETTTELPVGARASARWTALTPLLPWMLGLLTALVFLPSVANDFVGYDDPLYVTENANVLGGLSLRSIGWAFTTTHMGHWHPLTWLSIMLDVQLFGLRPWGHHLTSVLLHATAAGLVAWLFQTWTRRPMASLLAAALFAVHPLRVESVAWAAERKDVLCGVLCLLTLCAYTVFVRRPTWKSYALTLFCFALALLAKAMAVTLPVVMLLLDGWPFRRVGVHGYRRLVLEKLPFLALAGAVGVIAPLAVTSAGALVSLESRPLAFRIANAAIGYGEYLKKEFWPSGLSVFYPLSERLPVLKLGIAVVLLVAITAFAVAVRKGAPAVLVGWAWFVVMLGPVSGILQSGMQAWADRYTYLPSVGLSIAVVFGMPTKGLIPSGVRLALSVAVCCALVAVTGFQLGNWADTETLFVHAAEVSSPNPPAEIALGAIREEQGRLDEAEAHTRAGLALWPDYAIAQGNLGRILLSEGKPREALPFIEKAYAARPDDALTLTVYARILRALERRADADRLLESGIARLPHDSASLLLLGSWRAEDGNLQSARELFSEAVRRTPNLPAAHYNLGLALEQLGRRPEAEVEYRAALSLDERFAPARAALDAMVSGRSGAAE